MRDLYALPDPEIMECLGEYHDLHRIRMLLINNPEIVKNNQIDVEKFAAAFVKLDTDLTEDQGKEIAQKINSLV